MGSDFDSTFLIYKLCIQTFEYRLALCNYYFYVTRNYFSIITTLNFYYSIVNSSSQQFIINIIIYRIKIIYYN